MKRDFRSSGECPAGLEMPSRPDPLELVGGKVCFDSPGHHFHQCW